MNSQPSLKCIDICLNGTLRHIPQATTLTEILVADGLLGKRIAVERNGEIVPKSQHGITTLAAGDQLEIVVAVGGG